MGMKLSQAEEEGESNMSGDNTSDELETKAKLMSQAATIVNELISPIVDGREAILILPWADPVIPLEKEIGDQVQFSLTEKTAEDENNVELVHEGAEGP